MCIKPKCNALCAKHNHVLTRWHASCFWCSTRKAQYNRKYTFIKPFNAYLPEKFDCLTSILNNGTGYIVYYDETRFLAKIKQVLLIRIFACAENMRYTKIAKRVYLICEFLCT